MRRIIIAKLHMYNAPIDASTTTGHNKETVQRNSAKNDTSGGEGEEDQGRAFRRAVCSVASVLAGHVAVASLFEVGSLARSLLFREWPPTAAQSRICDRLARGIQRRNRRIVATGVTREVSFCCLLPPPSAPFPFPQARVPLPTLFSLRTSLPMPCALSSWPWSPPSRKLPIRTLLQILLFLGPTPFTTGLEPAACREGKGVAHWPTPDVVMREPVFNFTEHFASRAVVNKFGDLILPQSDGTLSLYTIDRLSLTTTASRRVWTVDALVLGNLATSPGADFISAVVAKASTGWHEDQQYSLVVLHASNGSKVWDLDLKGASPKIAIDDVRLILLYSSNLNTAYDLTTGRKLWDTTDHQLHESVASFSAILSFNGFEAGTFTYEGTVNASRFILITEKYFYMYDTATGHSLGSTKNVGAVDVPTVLLARNWLYFATGADNEPRQLWMFNIDDFQNVTSIGLLKANDVFIGNIDMNEEVCSGFPLPDLNLFVVSPGNATSPNGSYVAYEAQSKTPGLKNCISSILPFVSQRPLVRAARRYAYRNCTKAGSRVNAYLAAGFVSAWGSYSANGLVSFQLITDKTVKPEECMSDDTSLHGAAFDYDNGALFVPHNPGSDLIYVLTPSVVLGITLPKSAIEVVQHPWPPMEFDGLSSNTVLWKEGFAAATWKDNVPAVQAVFVDSSLAWKQDFSASHKPDLSAATLASCPQSSVVFSDAAGEGGVASVLYLVGSSGVLFSIMADTGDVLWLSNATASTMPKSDFLPSTPACDTTSAFVLHADTMRLLRISSRDGTVLWVAQVGQQSPYPPAPPSSSPSPAAASDPLLVGDALFFFSSAAQILSAVSRFSGAIFWTVPMPDTRVAQIANYGSQLIVVTDYNLLALDMASGASLWLIPVFDMVPMRPLVLLTALVFVDRVYGGSHYGLFVDPESGTVVRNFVIGGSDGESPTFVRSATSVDGRFLLSTEFQMGFDRLHVWAMGVVEGDSVPEDKGDLVAMLVATKQTLFVIDTPTSIVFRPDGVVAMCRTMRSVLRGQIHGLRLFRFSMLSPPAMAADQHLPGYFLQARGECTPCPAGIVCPINQPPLQCKDPRQCPVGSAALLPAADAAGGVAASSTADPTVDTQLLPLHLKDPNPLLTAALAALGGFVVLLVMIGIAHACGVAVVFSTVARFFGVPVAELDKTKEQCAPIKSQGDSVGFVFSILYLGSFLGIVVWFVVIHKGRSVTATTVSVAPSFVANALTTPTDIVLQFDLAGGLGLACDNRLRLKQNVFVAADNKVTPLSIIGKPWPTMEGGSCRVELTCAGCSLAPSAVRRQYGCVEVTALVGFAAARLALNSSASSQPSASFAARTEIIASSSATPMLKPVFQVSATAFHSLHPEATERYTLVHFEGLSGSSNNSVLVDECRQAQGGAEARNGTVYFHVSVDATVVVRTAEYRHARQALFLAAITLSLQALSTFDFGTKVIRWMVETFRSKIGKRQAKDLQLIAAYPPTEDDEASLIQSRNETL